MKDIFTEDGEELPDVEVGPNILGVLAGIIVFLILAGLAGLAGLAAYGLSRLIFNLLNYRII